MDTDNKNGKIIFVSPEARKLYNKKYYESHKTVIGAKLAEKRNCPVCGSIVTMQNMTKHRQTSKCKAKQQADDKKELAIIKEELHQLRDEFRGNRG
jgi:hypothetical protein